MTPEELVIGQCYWWTNNVELKKLKFMYKQHHRKLYVFCLPLGITKTTLKPYNLQWLFPDYPSAAKVMATTMERYAQQYREFAETHKQEGNPYFYNGWTYMPHGNEALAVPDYRIYEGRVLLDEAV